MDIFKTLTRSSKLSKSARKPSAAQHIPSSGEPSNPQLFGHVADAKDHETSVTPSTSSKKRKRGQHAPVQPVELPAGLDLLGDARGQKNTGNSAKTINGDPKTEISAAKSKDVAGLDVRVDEDDSEEHLTEEDYKRILRSHRIKVTVLGDHKAVEAEADSHKKKKRKKSKTKGKAELPAAKKTKEQLYPRPLTSFGQLRSQHEVPRRLAENIQAQGYKLPSEVQLAGIPLLLGERSALGITAGNGATTGTGCEDSIRDGGVDLLTVAPTGSGKTLAFLIPVLDRLIRRRKTGTQQHSGPQAVILAHSKEVIDQIVNEGRKLASNTGIKIARMKKGMEVVFRSEKPAPYDEEFSSNDDKSTSEGDEDHGRHKGSQSTIVKADVLVCTPDSLLNALKEEDEGETNEYHLLPIPSVRYLVLDEADRLLDPGPKQRKPKVEESMQDGENSRHRGFQQQTLEIWSACSNPDLRVSLWSATMDSSVEELVQNTIKARWFAISSSSSNISRPPLVRLVVGLKDTALPTITQKLVYAGTEAGKLLGLRQLLHPTTSASDSSASIRPPFIIFVQNIERADQLHEELKHDIPPEAGGSARIGVLHSKLSDAKRASVMKQFYYSEVWVLITTDLLARGVDFRGLNGIVNYDIPHSARDYIHRVGRTGRAGREGGVAVTFYTNEDIPFVKNIANVIAASEKMKKGGDAESKQWLLDALPTPSKREKQQLKRGGVKARNLAGKEAVKMRISTKSGYERQLENRRKGAKEGSRRRKAEETPFESFED